MNELTRQQLLSQSLRELADWYDSHPSAPTPTFEQEKLILEVYRFDATPAEIRSIGAGEKEFGHNTDNFRYWVNLDNARIKFVANRAKVCTAKVVGFREIPEQHVEAHVIPAKREDIIQWECRESLLAQAESEVMA